MPSQIQQIKGLELITNVEFAFGSWSFELSMWPKEMSMKVKEGVIRLKKQNKPLKQKL